MGSDSRSYRDSTITDPDSMSDKALFDLSLTRLSKSLPQATSTRSTLSIYLRWLEVHRQEPTKRTEHWQNTLLHWAQSLRSRGFQEHAILHAVDNWKEANGPFRSKQRRYPPMNYDISKAFEEMRQIETMDKMGDSYYPKGSIHRRGDSPARSNEDFTRPRKNNRSVENYEGPPPPNYVCNRCKKKGTRCSLRTPSSTPHFHYPVTQGSRSAADSNSRPPSPSLPNQFGSSI